MKVYLLVLSLFFLFGCNSIKKMQLRKLDRQIERIKAKYPNEFKSDTIYYVKNDTFFIETIEYEHDTIVTNNDTVIVETDRFKTRIIKDTLNQLQINTIIKSDTIEVIQIDTITTIKESITTKTKNVKYIPMWLIALCVGLAALFIITYIRYLNFTN